MEELEERMNVLRETLTKGRIDRDGFAKLRQDAHEQCEKDDQRRKDNGGKSTQKKPKIDITWKTETP